MLTSTTIALLAIAVFMTFERAVADPHSPPIRGPIDPKIIAAYERHGAEYGTFDVGRFGRVEFSDDEAPISTRLRGFRFNWLRHFRRIMRAKLPSIQVAFGLELGDMLITDAGLRKLVDLNFENLTVLGLSSTWITGAGLAVLTDLKNLTTLDLGNTRATDAGLRGLSSLKNLASLNLSGTKITDTGLNQLAGLENLASLNLSGTKITDTGLNQLAGLQKITALDLGFTDVTGAGLSKFVNLRNIDLTRTKLTSEGFKQLQNLENLTEIDLGFTKLTAGQLKDIDGLELGSPVPQHREPRLLELASALALWVALIVLSPLSIIIISTEADCIREFGIVRWLLRLPFGLALAAFALILAPLFAFPLIFGEIPLVFDYCYRTGFRVANRSSRRIWITPVGKLVVQKLLSVHQKCVLCQFHCASTKTPVSCANERMIEPGKSIWIYFNRNTWQTIEIAVRNENGEYRQLNSPMVISMNEPHLTPDPESCCIIEDWNVLSPIKDDVLAIVRRRDTLLQRIGRRWIGLSAILGFCVAHVNFAIRLWPEAEPSDKAGLVVWIGLALFAVCGGVFEVFRQLRASELDC
jgi:hypothetical protein